MKRGVALVVLVTAAAAALALVSSPHHAPPKDRSAPSTSASPTSPTSPPSPSTSSAPSPSVPPPSGPALVSLRLAGTYAVLPESADAVVAIRDGVAATSGVAVAPEQIAVVTSSSDSLTCLVDLVMSGRPPALVTARLVNGRWILVGPR